MFVFPNLMINRYGQWMDTNVVRPTGPTTCTVRFDWWLEPRLAGDAATVQQACFKHISSWYRMHVEACRESKVMEPVRLSA